MKLLLDQNVSYRLAKSLASAYPGTAHVRQFNLHEADDEVIWRFAAENDFVIVSKDADFHQRSCLLGHPPKFVWIRRGNCSTAAITEVLIHHVALVRRFYEDPTAAFLILD